MSRVKYPPSLFCPYCKAEIKLDYEGRLKEGDRSYAASHDLLAMNIAIPYSWYSAKDAKRNKQDLRTDYPIVLICQHRHTILGVK
jgi:hypothetical protein